MVQSQDWIQMNSLILYVVWDNILKTSCLSFSNWNRNCAESPFFVAPFFIAHWGDLCPRQSSPGAMNLVASKALKAVHSVLGQAALDFVVEEDLKAHLTCWYIQKYVKENPLPQYLERLQP